MQRGISSCSAPSRRIDKLTFECEQRRCASGSRARFPETQFSGPPLPLAHPRDATPARRHLTEFTPASTTMTRARHIHAARGRRKEGRRARSGAGWGTASAETNFNHGVAVVAHRLYSGVGRVGNTDSVCNITTTETPKNGQLVPEMAKRWIGARPASFRYLNSNEHYLV